MFVVEHLHDDLGGLEEIVLFSLGKPELRLNSGHTFGQILIRFGYFGIGQVPK
jgi:hypothetical protein